MREQSPGTPIPAIAITLNNIANCYRRMGKFAEAFTAVSRAIDLLRAKEERGWRRLMEHAV